MRELIANQIADEDPPEVWRTARDRRARRMHRLFEQRDSELLREVVELLDMLDEDRPDAVAIRRALELFHDPTLLEVVAES